MTNFTRIPFGILFAILIHFSAYTQSAGDFRSKQTGDWGDFNTWQVFDGTVWNDAIAGQFPGGTDESDANNVYLEAGHTITVESEHSCKDLHLNATPDVVRISTGSNSLNVWGKMRFYDGTAPGSGTANPVTSSGILGWISTGANGYIRFRGTADRVVMVQGEVNSNNNNSGWNMDFAFDNGFVGELNDRIRATSYTVSSGELFINNPSAELRCGTHSSGDLSVNGSCVIKSGATVRGGAGIFKSGIAATQTITVENGATLVITRSDYVLAAASLNLDGTVILEGSIEFPTDGGRGSAVTVNTFTDLTLQTTGAKTLQNNVTVNGTLNRSGTASLNLNGFTLGYGPDGTLEYSGTSAQTSTNSEFPTTSGPNNLTINNSNGVALHADRTVEGLLTLTSGLLDLGNYNLTLGASSPTIAGIPSVNNMIVTSGTGELRKIFSSSGTFFYPIGETTGTTDYTYAQITVNSATTLDGSTYFGMRVLDAEHPADNGVAFDNISRYWALSSNMAGINYNGTFQYLTTDVINDEADLSSYLYDAETALSSGSVIGSVNTSFHRVLFSNATGIGFATATNLCNISNNTIAAPTTVDFCNSTAIDPFDATAATVTSGSPTYLWQQSVDGGAWTDISVDGQNEDYTEPSTLSPGIYEYRRVVSDLVNCSASTSNISNTITITVAATITDNTIGNDETVTSGGDPAALVATATIGGGTEGTFNYQWQSSTTQGGPYSDISLETNDSYDPPSGIAQTTYYVRQVTSGACSSTSNEVTVTVNPAGINTALLSGIKVYPNPVANELDVNLDLSGYKTVQISIVNSKGETIYKTSASSVADLKIDLSAFPAGMYFAQVIADEKDSISYKIIKE